MRVIYNILFPYNERLHVDLVIIVFRLLHTIQIRDPQKNLQRLICLCLILEGLFDYYNTWPEFLF